MDNIIIEGLANLEQGFKVMIAEIPQGQQQLLDNAAEQAKTTMIAEAPKGIHRQFGTPLSESITVISPDANTRIIEPEGRNILPGNKYASAIEYGSHGGRMPNPISIALYYGVSEKVGYAIALRIKERGTPANPFVSRTYEIVQSQLEGFLDVFLMNVTSKFGEGAIA